MAVLGAALGSITGGSIIKYGRRRVLLIANIIGIASNLVMLYFNWYVLLAGRVAFGFATGIAGCCINKFIQETVPQHLYESLGVSFLFAQCCGNIVAFSLGELLPDDKDTEALKATNRWMFIYTWVPAAFQVFSILGLLLVVKEDSIQFLVQNERYEEARAHIMRVYSQVETESDAELFLQAILVRSGKDSSGVTLGMALCDPQHRTATWINFTYIIFHELTGINVINMFSNTMFTQMDKEGFILSPRQSTYFVGGI